MAANDVGPVRPEAERSDARGYIGAAYVVVAATVLIVSFFVESIDARLAWILVTVLTVGYMLGSGLERSGLGRR